MSNDKFYKDIADRLSDYEMPVSDSVWDAIASSMESVPEKKPVRKPLVFIPFIGVAAAASIAALLFFTHKPGTSSDYSLPSVVVADASHEDSSIQVVEPVLNPETSLLADNAVQPKKTSVPARTTYLSNDNPLVEVIEDNNQSDFEEMNNIVQEQNIDSGQTWVISGSDSQINSTEEVKDNQEVIDYWAAVEMEERLSETLGFVPVVNAGLYTASASSLPTIGFMDYANAPIYENAPNSDQLVGTTNNIYSSDKINGFIPKEQFGHSRHQQPVRLGVAVGYKFAPRFSVESGIVWSSLHSSFREEWTKKDCSQNLQYVGIPLSIVWTFRQGERLSFYLSGGTMLEKCVSGKFGTANIKEHPWQWSIMDAIGAQYTFAKRIGLFIEPGIAYYFDDGSSLESVYKENPTVGSLKLGLRVNL